MHGKGWRAWGRITSASPGITYYDFIINMTKKYLKDLDAPVLFPTSMLLTFNELCRNVRS